MNNCEKPPRKRNKAVGCKDQSLLHCGNASLLDQLQFLNTQRQETSESTVHFQETKSKVENFLSKLREENEKLFQNQSSLTSMEASQEEECFIEMNIFVDQSLGELVKHEEEAFTDKPLIEELKDQTKEEMLQR